MRKISTLFKKDPNDLGRVIDEVNPGNEWALEQSARATRKFDGMASAIIGGELYKRKDFKRGKQPPADAIECQAPDKHSGHHPHWVRCRRDDPADKVVFEAFDALEDRTDGTYELCGETISTERFTQNFNVEGVKGHKLIRHGCETLHVPNRTFVGIQNFFKWHNVEGIVFYHPAEPGTMCKIRQKDFGMVRPKMEIFEIDGVRYRRSNEPLKDGDEVFCIIEKEGSKVPYGTKGRIASVWYDRVEYLGQEYVIWGNETAKLVPVE